MATAPIAPTNNNLKEIAAPLMARWLIDAAENHSDLTYGEARQRLELEHGFSSIGRATRLGYPAGELMNQIDAHYPGAPLLNVLLVLQADHMPSTGARSFLADRFELDSLRPESSRKRLPNLWRQSFEQAASEAYAFKGWRRLYKRAFGEAYSPPRSELSPRNPKAGHERDGIPRGRGGEGPNHKALRFWVRANPLVLFPRLGDVRAETEVDLDSGDRVDVVYYASGRTIALEVKSRDSNDADLHRGVFQCVKYSAVMRAMDPRHTTNVEVCLVTERALPGYLDDLAKLLQVPHRQINVTRGAR